MVTIFCLNYRYYLCFAILHQTSKYFRLRRTPLKKNIDGLILNAFKEKNVHVRQNEICSRPVCLTLYIIPNLSSKKRKNLM